jgi:hypothetical protein
MIKSRKMRWAGHVARMVETRNAYRILVGKPLGRPRRRWVDLRAIEWDGTDWINQTQDRDQWRALVNTAIKPSGSLKCWNVPEWLHKWQLLRKGSAP